jgi:hypothetical protein
MATHARGLPDACTLQTWWVQRPEVHLAPARTGGPEAQAPAARLGLGPRAFGLCIGRPIALPLELLCSQRFSTP